MATSMMLGRCMGSVFLRNTVLKSSKTTPVCCYCTKTLSKDDVQVKYPNVKPEYPPGSWGEIAPKVAWHLHETATKLNTIPNVTERLESLGGEKARPIWQLRPLDELPGLLPYKQHVTKTHIIDGSPDIYNQEQTDVESISKRLKSHFMDLLIQEHEGVYKERKMKGSVARTPRHQRVYPAHVLMGQLVNMVYAALAAEKEYLLRSQLDENVRIESFWFKGGYNGDDMVATGKSYEDMLLFQSKHNASYQIRTELPLPEFVPLDDPLCHGEVPKFLYAPKTLFQHFTWDRPISVSGHWIADPCEFSLMSICVLDESYDAFVREHGSELAQEETKTFALVAGFGSAAAQAHNQGFNQHWDVTYPFTSQVAVTDGRMFRFCAYQLNTLHLWLSDAANTRRNLMWVTESAPLYDVIEGGQVKGFNDEVMKNLLQCILLAPRERGVDLRPYLPQQPAPSTQKKFINHKGEEPLPHPEIGRFQYPRNAIYF